MNLASILENKNKEKRIAITPEIAKKYISLGFNISLPKNYGSHLGYTDEEYKNLDVSVLDNEDHKNTWNNFTKFVMWGTVAVILVLILMAIFLL